MRKLSIGILLTVLLPALANALEIAKEEWVTAVKTVVPTHFCQPAQYFRQCYKVTATECEEVSASTTRICLSELNNQIPNVLVQPKDGTFWGGKVASCAAIAYGNALILRSISNAKCNDSSNW